MKRDQMTVILCIHKRISLWARTTCGGNSCSSDSNHSWRQKAFLQCTWQDKTRLFEIM